MKQNVATYQTHPGLTRRQLLSMGVLGLSGLVLAPQKIAHAALQDDLELVSLIPEMAEREGPLLIFRDFEADPDVEIKRLLRRQLGQRKDLQAQLKKKIRFDKQVKLSIDALEVRLMFVPQLQKGHSAAYLRFCREITDFFFEMIQEDSFYAIITSPNQNYPAALDNGISAFLVHRLAKAYRATCGFTGDSGNRVSYKATGAIFSNHLGAVDLEIQMVAPGRFALTRKPYTIWQNDTETLYTLVSIPLEETLHYYLGRATDREISGCIEEDPPKDLNAAWRLAEEWMAVEEALVGGLVNQVLRRYCARYQLALSPLALDNLSPVVPNLPQYRYRNQGMRLVEQHGPHDIMAMYMHSPADFRAHLLRPNKA